MECEGFCGITILKNDSSECGSCSWGYRSEESICTRCVQSLSAHAWMYLGFMAMIPLLLHGISIDYSTNRKSRRMLLLHTSALIECLLSAMLALVIMRPVGSLRLHSCGVQGLRDWYPVFYNPPRHHCTQEVVYPLYTILMIYYAFQLPMMGLFRPLFSHRSLMKRDLDVSQSVYSALYFLPALVVIQACLGGLLYYTYPYLTLGGSVLSLLLYLTKIENQTSYHLIKTHLSDGRSIAILIIHWLLHAYGILALTGFGSAKLAGSMLLLVPVPFIFYSLTTRYTDPQNVDNLTSNIRRARCCS